MPYELKLDDRPAGYALETAAGQGQLIKVAVREFTSSEDGELFVSRLEGIPAELVRRLPVKAGVSPSMIDHLLAIIRPDLSTTVYVNECKIFTRVRTAHPIHAGEAVSEDDIVDIESYGFEGVDIPDSAAVVCLFSSGWRKGLFFDVAPLSPEARLREYSLEKVLGSYFAYLLNQSVFKLDESQWRRLFDERWFPFVTLPRRVVRDIVAAIRSGVAVDRQLEKIIQATKAMAPQLRTRWSEAILFAPHLPLLLHALDCFIADDHVSATAILYPRIEGILRSMHEALGAGTRPTSRNLSSTAVRHVQEDAHPYSWLLPDMFRRFLEEVYFADFVPGTQAQLSRHSVGHGVAPAADFNAKAACIGILIVDQLRFLIPGSVLTNNALEPTAPECS
jgi:hypothetical protein